MKILNSNYGKIALNVVNCYQSGDLGLTWEQEAQIVFPDSETAAKKTCPKYAFLGLAEAGKIKGIPPGNYTKSKLNKQYALLALHNLKQVPELRDNKSELWRRSCGSKFKTHNQQMDVVLALWDAKYLI